MDKEACQALLQPYVNKTSGQFIYRLEREAIPGELEKLAQVYHTLYNELKDRYGDVEIFKILARVYDEHFTVVEEKVTIKTTEEFHSRDATEPR